MAKEGLFNILNNHYYFDEIKVMDLFAGTGNISFEFASRGATAITTVDSHLGCVQFITKISKELDFNIHVTKADAFQFLERCKETYDVIFADPPYSIDAASFQRIPQMVFENGLLNEDGLLVVEHAPETDLSSEAHFSEIRKYGSSVFSFFENPKD